MANVNYLNRPNVVKVFAANSTNANYLPVRFGTTKLASKADVGTVANDNFEYGLESLEGDLQLRDLNSVFMYTSSNLAYLFQQGIPEFSPYQNYPAGAVVQYNGTLWVATKEAKASKAVTVESTGSCGTTHTVDATNCGCCNPVQVTVNCACDTSCEEVKYPSKENGWCALVTHCEYDTDLATLKATDEALQTSIDNLKGVDGFSILPNKDTGVLELTLALSDGSTITIPMTKFGHIKQNDDGSLSITNADGSKLELPKYVAEKDLDQSKGFYFNDQSKKWEVDLADLVKNGSGLQVDKNGYISVKPSDLVDGDTLNVNANTGKMEIDPDWYKTKVEAPLTSLDSRLDEIETNGATVYVSKPIVGTGKKDNPLTLKLSSNDFELAADGSIRLKGTNTNAVTSLNNLSILGYSTFFGYINKANNQYVYGVPADIDSANNTQASTKQISELVDGENYDFNGWQIASTVQVDQYLIGVGNVVWHRMNDAGMNADGTLADTSAWTDWNRETNVNITVQQMEQVQADLRSLTNRVKTIEAILASFEQLTDASGTITLGYIKP